MCWQAYATLTNGNDQIDPITTTTATIQSLWNLLGFAQTKCKNVQGNNIGPRIKPIGCLVDRFVYSIKLDTGSPVLIPLSFLPMCLAAILGTVAETKSLILL
jgi:hypothetical protein